MSYFSPWNELETPLYLWRLSMFVNHIEVQSKIPHTVPNWVTQTITLFSLGCHLFLFLSSWFMVHGFSCHSSEPPKEARMPQPWPDVFTFLSEADDGWSRFFLFKASQLVQQWWLPCNDLNEACSMRITYSLDA